MRFFQSGVFDGDMDSYLEYLGKINQAAAQRADGSGGSCIWDTSLSQIHRYLQQSLQIIHLTGLTYYEKEELINEIFME